MGNICRSPTAHGVFQSLVDELGLNSQISVDSAGTHGYHLGNSPDIRSQAVARKRGVDLSSLKARQFSSEDFLEFDYLLAMDQSNYSNMERIQPDTPRAKLSLMLDYSDLYSQLEVPDPYYGEDGFELVFDMIFDASNGLLRAIREKHSI